MSEHKGAYVQTAPDTNFRRKWDRDEYAKKAREKDEEERDRLQENEERVKQGKRPRRGPKEVLPEPKELMQQHNDLKLDENLNKTIVVANPTGRGPGQPGFYCEACNRTYKDTTAYLGHINGRAHLRKIGQSTRIARSTVEQVRARIAFLREKMKEASKARAYDFHQRLAEIKVKADAEREAQKAQKKAEKEMARQTVIAEQNEELVQFMGFGGFGSSKK